MRTILKIAAVLVVMFLLLLVFAYVSTVHGTRYARGYTEVKFKSIQRGMTQKDVKRILGEPVSVERHKSRRYQVKLISGKTVPVLVTYNDDGKVRSADGRVAEARGITYGMYKRDAESSLHTTSSTHGGYRYYLHYTRPYWWANEWELRDIEIDENGRVDNIESYFVD